MPPDMFLDPDQDPRTEPPARGDERDTLVAFLQWQRDTFGLKCSGLDATALAARPIAPSVMSLLGLARHLADVERGWFRRVMAGQEAPPLFRTEVDRDAAFTGARPDPAVVEQAFAAWRQEMSFADRFIADAPDLDVTGHDAWLGPTSLRWVLVHLIEEYARHNGHVDLLREQLDGAVGQ